MAIAFTAWRISAVANVRHSKTKGRQWENVVVEGLTNAGWPGIERRRLMGTADRGDISGLLGVVVECKNTRSMSSLEMVRQADREAAVKGEIGFAVAKQHGKPRAEDAVVLMSWSTWLAVLGRIG
jgi:hypothetical protein